MRSEVGEDPFDNLEALSTESRARILGRRLVSASSDHEKLFDLQEEVAKLTAGIDPDSIDRESDDFKAGVSFVLSVAISSQLELPGSTNVPYYTDEELELILGPDKADEVRRRFGRNRAT